MNNLLMRELPLRCTIRLWDTYQVRRRRTFPLQRGEEVLCSRERGETKHCAPGAFPGSRGQSDFCPPEL